MAAWAGGAGFLGREQHCGRPQERRYAGLKPGELPTCESLKDTIARALPFWNEDIAPQIKAGKRVLIAAHGNSLRGIVKHLEGEAHPCRGCGRRQVGGADGAHALEPVGPQMLISATSPLPRQLCTHEHSGSEFKLNWEN